MTDGYFPKGRMLHQMEFAGGPSFVSVRAATSLRAKTKRLIARHWTKNCEIPVIGSAFIQAPHKLQRCKLRANFFAMQYFLTNHLK
ncbi:hypothetical protein [Thalassospira sp. MCCC 1A01428]|uniref:hypothetical protein n=1 Tax=Thalassospira sp. MCCC 1A01428 TaxID=1470575 RepID=UPI000A1F9F50|nr:hypothetical protein [Thalassospira sp. MCCC 1A01428]OSQ43047.1 hypothetical protein THS27_11620 [Thalassospira sp. MCCC 1A01428]